MEHQGSEDKMTRFKKHLGTGKEIIIEGETYVIKPLTTDEAPLFFKLMKLFDEKKGFDVSQLTQDTSDAISSILNKTLQKSFPEEWKENKEEVKEFGMKYMMDIFNAILEVNVPDVAEKDDKIAELKNRLNK